MTIFFEFTGLGILFIDYEIKEKKVEKTANIK